MIQFENVTKVYKNGYKANNNISFQVKPGEVLGIVGANGAGKSTLFRQLFGIISTTEGHISVDGKENSLENMAYVPQFPVIYPYLTVLESVELVLLYQGVKKKEARVRSKEILSLLGMNELEGRYTYALSGGQKKMLSFASAIVQNKKYLVLDEVTSMVDVLFKQKIWDLIHRQKSQSGILISSHDLDEIRNVCDRLLILKDGKMSYYGPISQIASQICKITVKVENMALLTQFLSQIPVDFELKNSCVDIFVKDTSQIISVLQEIHSNFEITFLNCEQPAFYEGVLKYV